MAQNAVTQITVDDIALNRGIVTNTDHSFSTFLDDWSVTNQKQSGRCWMFAGLNLLRVAAMKKMNTKEFEFSQNYTMFWDKLERANYFFEAIIETADRDVDDRLVAFLLEGPLGDGGQWNMFVNLVNKHGLVPKAFMPETESSSSTRKMNAILRSKLREGAKALRDMHAAGESSRGAPRDEAGVRAGRPSHPLHPSRHAAGALRLAVERQGRGIPSHRRGDAAGVRRAVRRSANSTTTSASSMTPGRAARSGGPSPSSTSATSSAASA